MARNKVQFQKVLSLVDFLNSYGTEDDCFDGLHQSRWPSGFICPHCGYDKHFRLTIRKLNQCNRCHSQASLSAGTIFESTKSPLKTWFLGIYIITQDKKNRCSHRKKSCLRDSLKLPILKGVKRTSKPFPNLMPHTKIEASGAGTLNRKQDANVQKKTCNLKKFFPGCNCSAQYAYYFAKSGSSPLNSNSMA
jgi:hypothetical protein